MTMIEEAVERMKRLAPERQREALDFLEFLEEKSGAKRPRRNLEGALSHLGATLREEDLEEVRREMWKNFPRDLEP